MRILLLAPHPFFQERGTPIAVDLLVRALADRGETIDLLTYHEGTTPDYPENVTIHRIPPQKLAKNIRPGFSIKKVICDIAMYREATRLAKTNKYDCIHAVEESVFIARRIGCKHNIPYIFDMDSSMPRQIADKIPAARIILPLMRHFESSAIRDAAAVVPMCDDLAELARNTGAEFVEVLRDISLLPQNHTPQPQNGFRKQLAIDGPTLLYIGNLEPYQGIDLMLDAFAKLTASESESQLVIVGGRDEDIQKYKKKADTLKISKRVHFLGPKPLQHMPDLFNDADILISPRTQGNNTPMKIYSYLDAGCPTIATNLPTHTQVMDSHTAELVEPTPESMAESMLKLIHNPQLRRQIAGQAKIIAREKYSIEAFRKHINHIYDYIAKYSPPQSQKK